MKRLIAVIIALFTANAGAQTFSTVSGTVVDSSGCPYAFGTVNILMTNQMGQDLTPGAIIIYGTTIGYVQPVGATLDGFGNFNVQVVNNNSVSNITGTQYRIAINSRGTGPNFTQTPVGSFSLPLQVINTNTNLNSQLGPSVVPQIFCNGGGGGGGAGNPNPPAFSVQAANAGSTGFTSDPSILLNPTAHTMTFGVGTGAPVASIRALNTVPSSWTFDVTTPTTALDSIFSLTTTGTGAATLTGTNLNIPTPTAGGIPNPTPLVATNGTVTIPAENASENYSLLIDGTGDEPSGALSGYYFYNIPNMGCGSGSVTPFTVLLTVWMGNGTSAAVHPIRFSMGGATTFLENVNEPLSYFDSVGEGTYIFTCFQDSGGTWRTNVSMTQGLVIIGALGFIDNADHSTAYIKGPFWKPRDILTGLNSGNYACSATNVGDVAVVSDATGTSGAYTSGGSNTVQVGCQLSGGVYSWVIL